MKSDCISLSYSVESVPLYFICCRLFCGKDQHDRYLNREKSQPPFVRPGEKEEEDGNESLIELTLYEVC